MLLRWTVAFECAVPESLAEQVVRVVVVTTQLPLLDFVSRPASLLAITRQGLTGASGELLQ